MSDPNLTEPVYPHPIPNPPPTSVEPSPNQNCRTSLSALRLLREMRSERSRKRNIDMAYVY
eukprot:1334117-Amorphochlora_amoeboformis.AAC.1